MFVTINTSGVAVREADLYSIVADDRGGFGARLGLKHRQGRKCGTPRGSCCGEGFFFSTLIVAGGTGTFVPQIGEVVVAGVAIGPGDVNASARLHVYFHGGRLSSRIEWKGHAGGRDQLFDFPLQQSPGGMGLPCGQVFGWPRNVQMR
jgi:hypothetical protein